MTSTASRRVCGLTTFLRLPPLTLGCPPLVPPRCASIDGSPPPVAATASPRSVPTRRTCSSSGKNTPSRPVTTAQFSRIHPGFGLLQDGDNLFFAESTLPHDSSYGPGGPCYMEKSHFQWTNFG